MRAGATVNERKRAAEELDLADEADTKEMQLIRKVEDSIKLMRLPDGGLLTDYGRMRKAGGDIEVYRDRSGPLIADWAFLFDKLIILCFKPKWLQHRYRYI